MSVDHVFLCSDYLQPSGGGVETVVENLARGYAERGIEVTVFSLMDDTTPLLANAPSIDVYRSNTLSMTETFGVQAQFSPRAVVDLARLIRSTDPDIVHLHNRYFFTTVLGALLKSVRVTKAPLVVTCHLGKMDSMGGTGGLAARLYDRTIARGVLGAADACIGVSNAVAKHALSMGAPKGATYSVPNAVDTEMFMPSNGLDSSRRILFVGRLIENKGPVRLLNAMPAILADHPDAEAWFVGEGPLREHLEHRARESGVDHAVRFLGRVESVNEIMQQADVFCRPSTTEGMPLTVLEAMACGLPPVVTSVGGVSEIVDNGETGILLTDGRPDDISQAISELFTKPEQLAVMGRAAREQVVNSHTWEQRTDAVLDIYESVVHK